MEPSKSILEEPCFKDFFPFKDKKYKPLYEDIRNMDDYEWNAYLNLLEADARSDKTYCKRKCYNQRFSPFKYNKQKNIYPQQEELLEFIRLMDADPTPDKSECIWAIENKNQLLGLDVSDVAKNIDLYLTNFPGKKLPHSYEQLLLDIKKTIYSFDTQDEEQDVKVLYDGKYGKLLVPQTEQASCKWGKGTKWCTASTEFTNFFENYFEYSPLYIWIERPGKKKYQFHFFDFEFKDMQNKKIKKKDLLYMRNKHPILKNLFRDGEMSILSRFITGEEPEPNLYPIINYYVNVLDMDWPELENMMLRYPDIANLFNQYYFWVSAPLRIIEDRYRKVTWDDEILETEDAEMLYNALSIFENIDKIEQKLHLNLESDDKTLRDEIKKGVAKIYSIFSHEGIKKSDFE